MSDRPLPAANEPVGLIRVSELGDWAYCNLAWKLRAKGARTIVECETRFDEGRQWHVEHGRTAARSVTARRIRNWCFAIALGVAAPLRSSGGRDDFVGADD